MGMAADALEDLTGVRVGKPKADTSKYEVDPDATNPAANALRDIQGVEQPTTFAERFKPAEEQPLDRINPKAAPPKPDNFGKIGIDFENQQLAASQRTAPNPANYKKLVSSDVYQNDAGELLYPDPNTGELVRTDSNKHVVLRDPEDNKLKIFERSPDTNEGILSAAGRMLGTGLATGAPVNRTFAAVNAAKPAEDVISASSRLGVTVPRAVSSDNMATQEIGKVAANVPWAGNPLIKASESTINQLGSKASEIAGNYGSASSVDAAGNTAKGSISDWISTSSKAKEKQLYDRVDSLIDPNAKGTLSSTQKIADTINSERNAAALGQSPAVKQVQEALDRGGLTYEGVKKLRTTIGEQLDSGILPADTSRAELKRLYGGLSDDLKSTVEASGNKPAVDAFNRANTYSRLVNDRRQSLAKIVGADGNAPAEAVFDRLKAMAGSSSRADIGKLAQARKAMGSDDWNEVASTVVGRLGRDVEGNFSPRRFLTDYGKISPAGKNMLFRSGGLSNLADSLDDIATISSRFKELEKFANPSGTSRSVTGFMIGSGVIPALSGDFVTPLKTLTGLVGGRLVSSALASPAGASSIAKWMRTNLLLAQTPTPARLAAFSTASKNLIATTGANVSVEDFLRALQSPATSRAEEQNVPGKPRE